MGGDEGEGESGGRMSGGAVGSSNVTLAATGSMAHEASRHESMFCVKGPCA